MVRFLHTADWQIGMTRHFLDGDAQPRYTGARLDVIRSITRVAEERNCEFIVVCGDVFEHNQLDRRVVVRTLDALSSSTMPVYLLPGNHDTLEHGSIYHSPTFKENLPDQIHVIDSSTPIKVSENVELVGAPWRSKRPLSDLLKESLQDLSPSTEVVRILAGHGITDELSPDPDNPALISVVDLESNITQGVVQYVALGDRHSVTSVGKSGRIRYSGTPEPTRFDESDPGSVLVVDIDSEECSVDPVKVGTWRFLDKHFDITGTDDLDAIESWLHEQPNKDRTIIRLSLEGTINIRQKARLDSILMNFSDLYAAIQEWDRHTKLAILADDHDFTDMNLTGYLDDAVEELKNILDQGGADRKEDARNALALLYRLAGEPE